MPYDVVYISTAVITLKLYYTIGYRIVISSGWLLRIFILTVDVNDSLVLNSWANVRCVWYAVDVMTHSWCHSPRSAEKLGVGEQSSSFRVIALTQSYPSSELIYRLSVTTTRISSFIVYVKSRQRIGWRSGNYSILTGQRQTTRIVSALSRRLYPLGDQPID